VLNWTMVRGLARQVRHDPQREYVEAYPVGCVPLEDQDATAGEDPRRVSECCGKQLKHADLE